MDNTEKIKARAERMVNKYFKSDKDNSGYLDMEEFR